MNILRLPSLLILLAIITGLAACEKPNNNNEGTTSHFYKDIHPLCIYRLAGDGGQDSIDLDQCITSDLDVTELSYDSGKNLNTAGFQYGTDEYPSRGFVGYRYIGSNSDGDILETFWNGGGSGVFSTLMAVNVSDGVLKVQKYYAGGDRCNGGIATADFTAQNTLVYGQHLTPYDLMTFSREDLTQKVKAFDDITACAACCYGVLEFENGTPRTVYLDENITEKFISHGSAMSEPAKQACFDRHIMTLANSAKSRWTVEEWKAVQDEIYTQCF